MNKVESIDQLNMRRSNLSLVLSEIIEQPRTRAQLASDVDMTRGAIGNLVNDLSERGLIRIAEESTTIGIGRPGFAATAIPGRVFGIGLSFSVPYVIGVAVDLTGSVIIRERVPLTGDVPSAQDLVDIASRIARQLSEKVLDTHPSAILSGVAVGVPDLIDPHDGIVRRSPTVGLTDFPLEAALHASLADLTDNITIDNDANYGGLAESRSLGESGGANLLYLTGSTSVGCGIVAAGKSLRGIAGYAGEVGHMVINPEGKRCTCGSTGCWESEVGLNAFLELVAEPKDVVRDSRIDIDERMDIIVERATAGDPQTLSAIQHVGRFLGLGVSNLINIFNPETVILGGYYIRLFPFLIQVVRRNLQEHVLSESLSECNILPSELAMYAGAIGAGYAKVQDVIADPTIVPRLKGRKLDLLSSAS